MKYSIVVLLVTFCLLQSIVSANFRRKLNSEAGPSDYELYEEVIYQPGLKDKVAISEVEWQGNTGTIITAIKVTPTTDKTEILEGGVGKDFVKLIIKSEKGKGNEYTVKIFGRN